MGFLGVLIWTALWNEIGSNWLNTSESYLVVGGFVVALLLLVDMIMIWQDTGQWPLLLLVTPLLSTHTLLTNKQCQGWRSLMPVSGVTCTWYHWLSTRAASTRQTPFQPPDIVTVRRLVRVQVTVPFIGEKSHFFCQNGFGFFSFSHFLHFTTNFINWNDFMVKILQI